MAEWINNNWIEVIGAALAFIYLILEIKQKWTFWIANIISSTFYVYIFFEQKVYAQAGLNSYYILMAAYGLYCWKFSKTQADSGNKPHHIPKKWIVPVTSVGIIFMGVIWGILAFFTNSEIPVSDAFVAAFSIIATWMVAKKIVECWIVWIVVDAFATGMYLYLKMYPTTILFVFYTVLSVVGLIEWRKSMIAKK
jgi:nicotinamide mononucleotide transporter